MHVKEDGCSTVICPCHLHDLHPVLDQPVCSMLVYSIARSDSQFLCRRVYILCDFWWPEVQSHSDYSHMHVTAPYSAHVLGQARPTMSCIF